MPLVGLAGWVKHVERCEDHGKLRDYTTRGCLGITGRQERVVVERRCELIQTEIDERLKQWGWRKGLHAEARWIDFIGNIH